MLYPTILPIRLENLLHNLYYQYDHKINLQILFQSIYHLIQDSISTAKIEYLYIAVSATLDRVEKLEKANKKKKEGGAK